MIVTNVKPQMINQTKIENISFGSGMSEVQHLIEHTNIKHVTDHFHKLGIPADFAGNKIVAACSGLASNIFMKLGLKLPTGIFVADFKLVGENNALGFCLNRSKGLGADYMERQLGQKLNLRNVFFNKNTNWDFIDQLSTKNKFSNHTSSKHFLHVFLHEFSHNAHIDHLYTKFGAPHENNLGYKTLSWMSDLFKKDGADILNTPFRTSTEPIKSRVSNYGATEPAEFVAENLTELIVKSLDLKTCMPKRSPFKNSQFVNGKIVDDLFKKAWAGKLPGC